MIRRATPLLVALVAALAAASAVEAAPAAQVCPSFTMSGVKIAYETLGSSWSCSAAKAWIVKLAADRVGPSSKNVPLKNGPSGYHCFATPRKQNVALDGTCIKGTIKFPGTGFAWLTGY